MPGRGVVKATKAAVNLNVAELLEIRAGKITYSSVSFDASELLRQLTRDEQTCLDAVSACTLEHFRGRCSGLATLRRSVSRQNASAKRR